MNPEGEHSHIHDRQDHPVVQVSWMMLAHTRNGVGDTYPLKQNGNMLRGADYQTRSIPGETMSHPIPKSFATYGKDDFPNIIVWLMVSWEPARLVHFDPMGMDSSTCQAMFGNGPAMPLRYVHFHANRAFETSKPRRTMRRSSKEVPSCAIELTVTVIE